MFNERGFENLTNLIDDFCADHHVLKLLVEKL